MGFKCALTDCPTNKQKKLGFRGRSKPCDKNQSNRISFHEVPKKECIKKQWESALSCTLPIDARICSLHFKESSFSISTKKRSLLPDVIPEIPCKTPRTESTTLSNASSSPNKTPLSPIINRTHIIEKSSDTEGPSFEMYKNLNDNSPCKTLISPNISSTDSTSVTCNAATTGNTRNLSRKRLFLERSVNNRDINISPSTQKKANCNIDFESPIRSKVPLTDAVKNIKSVYSDESINTKYIPSPKAIDISSPGMPSGISLLEDQTPQNADSGKYKCAKKINVVNKTKSNGVVSTRKQGRFISKLKKKLLNAQEKIKLLSSNIKELKKKDSSYKELKRKINIIANASENGNIKAQFLSEQVLAFGKKKVPFLESTLKVCSVWNQKSPRAYRYVRDLGILHMPHPKTLKRFLGTTIEDTGISSLVKARLREDFKKVRNEHEKLGSIICDEMAIKAKYIYDRKLDQFFGENEVTPEEVGVTEHLATHLLCFLFQGLATNYRLPVAYFFVAKLDGETLYKMNLQIIKEVEAAGFVVVRMVTDNAKTNVAAFKKFGGGTIKPVVAHPNDNHRDLFLSFDPSHVFKNIRNQFLEREMVFIGLVSSSEFVRKLYHMQKNNLIKPVRFLSRKHVYPTNLEKMNVGRAAALFHPSVTAALKTIITLRNCDVKEIENLDATIFLMEQYRKWYEIMKYTMYAI